MSAAAPLHPESAAGLDARCMPFTHNRWFNAHPRLIVAAPNRSQQPFRVSEVFTLGRLRPQSGPAESNTWASFL